jgi:hypothetical protein
VSDTAAPTLFVTVCFARPELLRWQHASLAHHVRGPWRLIVYDNARILRHTRTSERLRALCSELGVECREVRREAALEATAGQRVFRRRLFRPWHLWANPSLSHAFALTWAWRELAARGELAGTVGVLDSDMFLARDLDPGEWLPGHELAFVPQHAPERTYVWPGFALFAAERLPRLRELEWWLDGPGGSVFDAGARSHRFLRAHPAARTRWLRPRRFAEAPESLRAAPEEILGPEGDEPLALHFRCGSGWDRASREEIFVKQELVLRRAAWRERVTPLPFE